MINLYASLIVAILFVVMASSFVPKVSSDTTSNYTFTITDTTNPSTSSGYVGDNVTLAGSNLPSSQTYSVEYINASDPSGTGESFLCNVTTDSSGSFTLSTYDGAPITIPQTVAGTSFELEINSSYALNASFSVLPSISLNQTSCPLGISGILVMVTGNGFSAQNPALDNLLAAFNVGNNSTSVDLINTSTDGSGGNFQAGFVVPPLSAGSYNFTVTDNDTGDSVSAQFNVTLLTVGTPTTSSTTVYRGATSDSGYSNEANLSAVPSGGSGDYTYQWLVETPDANSFTDATGSSTGSNYTWSPSIDDSLGNYLFEVQVTDSLTLENATSPPVTVSLTHANTTNILVSGPSYVTAGQPTNFTASATDNFGNSWDVTSQVQWSINQTAGGSWNQSTETYTSATAGTWTITATLGTLNGTALLTVNPAAASILVVSAPSNATAGTAFNITVTAQDAYGNTATGYTGTVHFSSTDSQAVLPANSTLTGGVGNFSVTLKTSGSQTVIANDNVTSSIAGTSNSIAVAHAATVQINITPATATIAAGSSQSYNATAYDQYGNSWNVNASYDVNGSSISGNTVSGTVVGSYNITGYYGGQSSNAILTVTHASISSVSIAPSSTTLIAGESQSYSATASDAYGNTWDVTASTTWSISPGAGGSWNGNTYTSDKVSVSGIPWSVTATIDGVQNTSQLTVLAAALDYLSISPDSATISAGSPLNYVVDGYDANGNLIASDISASLTVNGTAINGSSINETVAGFYTIEADFDGLSVMTTLTVTPSVLNNFAFTTITTQSVDSAFNVTITAVDIYGNTVTSYDGTSTLVYSAGSVHPTSINFVSGVWNGNVTVANAGSNVTLSVAEGSINGTSNNFTVIPSSIINLTITPKATAAIVAGSSQSFTATAIDAYNNTWNVTDQVVWSISPGAGGSWVQANGTYTSATAGTWTITATLGTLNGTALLTVNPAAASILVVSAPSNATAGTAFNITVTAQDAYGNIITNYSDMVHFSSNDTRAVLPADSLLTNGTGTFSITLKTAGSETITVVDKATNAVAGASTAITVIHATAITGVTIAPEASSTAAGTSVAYNATASDAYGNTWDVTASTTWSISPGAGGSWNGNTYTSGNTGTWTITGTYASVSYTTTLAVNTGPVDYFVVTVPSSAAAGTAFNITVTAMDAYGNVVKDFTGTVSLTASNGEVTPATTGSFTAGVWTGLVTLSSTGSGTITASDGNGHSGASYAISINASSPSGSIEPMWMIGIEAVVAIAFVFYVVINVFKKPKIASTKTNTSSKSSS